MDFRSAENGFNFARKHKKWILVLLAFGFSSYSAYRVYHLPSIANKRRRISKLLEALISLTEAISYSSETITVVSKDLLEFLQSESNQIPNSIKQISKITNSNEFSVPITKITQALTVGILRGYRSESRISDGTNTKTTTTTPSSLDQVMDKLFSKAGSGFASIVVGSFARNLVKAFYNTDEQCNEEFGSKSRFVDSTRTDTLGSRTNSDPKWVTVVCSEPCRELISDCVQLFVSTAVAVYLDKTKNINTYDEFFAGLTNPNHETKVRDVLVSVCNGAVETLLKTSHQLLNKSPGQGQGQGQGPDLESDSDSNPTSEDDNNGFGNKLSTTLSLPTNRRLVLDMTGQMTSATVKSLLEFSVGKLHEGVRQRVNNAHDTVAENGREVMRYVTAKSSVVATVCLSMCLHVLNGPWILAPPPRR